MIGQWPAGFPLLADRTPDIDTFLKLDEVFQSLLLTQVHQSGGNELKLLQGLLSVKLEEQTLDILESNGTQVTEARVEAQASKARMLEVYKLIQEIEKNRQYLLRQQRLEQLKAASAANVDACRKISGSDKKKCIIM